MQCAWCGYVYADKLGKYGCPNCLAEGLVEPIVRTREEHVAWCKERALEYVDEGDNHQALASMMSDLGKHTETVGHMGINLGLGVDLSDSDAVRKWIEGFN